MRAIVAATLLASLAVFAPTALAHHDVLGSPNGYVNDFAQVLSPQVKESLGNELSAFEQTTSNEIVVVIVSDLDGDYVENYAVELFKGWGIGKKEKDNGVLLLLSIEERKMRIEVGYGLEGALPDSVAQHILNNDMTPLLKAGDYDGAVTAGVHAIEEATKGEYVGSPMSSVVSMLADNAGHIFVFGLILLQFLAAVFSRSRSWWAGGVIGLLGAIGFGWLFALGSVFTLYLVGVLTPLGLLFDYVVSRGYQNAKARGITPPWWIGGSGGRGGGGFGGFGGGSSGGGGASGGW